MELANPSPVRRMGRPPKPALRKDRHIKVYCNEAQYRVISKQATRLHTTLSDYLLRRGMDELNGLPVFRTLPADVQSHLLILRQLAGAFTLAALKTEREVALSSELRETATRIRSLVTSIETFIRHNPE